MVKSNYETTEKYKRLAASSSRAGKDEHAITKKSSDKKEAKMAVEKEQGNGISKRRTNVQEMCITGG